MATDGVVYKTQSLLDLSLDMSLDVSGGTSPVIVYKKPNGVRGEWVATIDTTALRYAMTHPSPLDVEGTWQLQPVCFVAGRKILGLITEIEIADNL